MVLDAGNLLVRKKGWSQNPDAKELARRRARADLILRFYDKVGAAAIGLGPEDLALGWKTLRSLIQGRKARILCANLRDRHGKPLLPGSALVQTKLGPVGIVAAAWPTRAAGKLPDGLKFEEPEKVLPPLVEELKKKGAKTIILLAAMSRQRLQKVVQAVHGIDFAIGAGSGYWSTRLLKYGDTFVMGTPPGGKHIGVLELHLLGDTWRFADLSLIPFYKKRIRNMLRSWRRYRDLTGRLKGKPRERYEKRILSIRRSMGNQVKALEQALTQHKPRTSFVVNRIQGLDSTFKDDPDVAKMVNEVKRRFGIDDTKRRAVKGLRGIRRARRPILPGVTPTQLKRVSRVQLDHAGLRGPIIKAPRLPPRPSSRTGRTK